MLSPGEQSFVADLLTESETDLFWKQQPADLRHSHDCARHVADHSPGRTDLIRAALLHDIGKQQARLGPLGRTVATLVGLMGIRGSERHASYNRHSVVGAEMLSKAGAEETVIAYTLHHHADRPSGFDPGDWNLLMRADHVS